MSNHLNIFNSFKNKAHYHEDELTRTFLVLIKNIPVVQAFFIEMIRKDMIEKACEKIIPSLTDVQSEVVSLHTQITETNKLFTDAENRRAVSILISDDKLYTDKTIKNDSRKARYDGVIQYNPEWLLIIENKPNVNDVWVKQLNPNLDENIQIEEKPVTLSWRSVIEGLGSLIQKKMVSGLEEVFIKDFLEYVDNEFPQLKPFTSFSVCQGNEYLLIKRCISIMEKVKMGEVLYHKGWKHYINIGKESLKEIALSPILDGDSWNIAIEMYPGDSMNQARNFYNSLNKEELLNLIGQGWEITPNMHFSFRAQNLIWTTVSISIENYIDYWKENYRTLGQVKRVDFIDYFNLMEQNGCISSEDWNDIEEKIINKKYQKINVCPGVRMCYSWDRNFAIKNDRGNKFVELFKQNIQKAVKTWGLQI